MSLERIAFLLPSLRGGGAERVTLSIANELSTSHLVDLVLVRAEGPYIEEVADEVRLIDLNAARVATSLPSLVLYLRRQQPDVLFSALSHINIAAIAARWLSRQQTATRLVVSERNHLSSSSALASERRSCLLPPLMRLAYPHANAIVAISEGVADDLSRRVGVARDKVDVIHNPLVTTSGAEDAAAEGVHPWFAPGQPPVVLAAGRLSPQKDFPSLIGAFAELRRERDLRLVILGEGVLRPELERLVCGLGVGDDVAMPGFVPDPQAYMRRAAVFVLSSSHEGFGNVLLEAMACGTPVVSTDCPSGPSEILEGGRWGRLVPVGDVGALAAAMHAALDDPDPPPVRERAEEFTIERILTDYKRVLGVHPAGPGRAP